jgi:DNA-binding transcriptional regulator of glucitol operon
VATASFRFAWHPRWVAGHLLVLAAVVTMVLLGRWQLLVSDRKHFNLQNFGYALQWWAFSVFAVVFWLKIVRDAAIIAPSKGSQPAEAPAVVDEPVAYRRYVMPNQTPDADPEMVRYNAYLAALADQDDKS